MFRSVSSCVQQRNTLDAVGNATRVRFAPSPTGFLHVGGLRTALFNYLLARNRGGQCILRIEDTDQSRLVPGAADALQSTLTWTGIHFDEGPSQGGNFGPYVQSERLEIYQKYAKQLLKDKLAYRDFRPLAQRQLGARTSALMREAYIPPGEDEAQERMARGEQFVIRLKMDPDRTFEFEDAVYGTMSFRPYVVSGASDDPIILKSDGWPTYHLASVVDDSEMAISHVLRGEEWLPSMPKHLAIYEALQIKPPQFAHLPLLINADGSKLSKRSGDVRVDDYRVKGIEPEALVNLVALTGYNHQHSEASEGEVLNTEQLIDDFELNRISHSRATLPTDKLPFLNRRHIVQKMQDTQQNSTMLARLRPLYAAEIGADIEAGLSDHALLEVASLGCQRVDTLAQIPASTAYFFQKPRWNSKECRDFRKSIPDQTFDAVLTDAKQFFQGIMTWDLSLLHTQLQDWMKKQAHGRAAVQKSLRTALTGLKAGPPVADIAFILGQSQTIERLHEALSWDQAQR
ncbi:glutamate--tRNA ligase [Malassezia yamatoensis]|uniref:Glutamate--tRNA ligase, mitochondrial n=1 Tax=Malassezia yamatoensis TaxID=253288 RepID=A0AAJ5YS53_9BASI|nr:glutamate--tRNA ligase [Malassezia yamatoensis]